MCDVGSVYKAEVQRKPNAFYKKGRATMLDDFEVGDFSPHPAFLNWSTQMKN